MNEFFHQTLVDSYINSRLPGYFLAEKGESTLETNRIIEEGMNRFFGGFGNKAMVYDTPKHSIVLIVPEDLSVFSCMSFYRQDDNFAFIEGTFNDYDLLRRNRTKTLSSDLANEVLQICIKEEYTKLKEYNGRYSGFVYVKKHDKLIVITDSYGANRVFSYDDSKHFIVSNNLFAISTNPALSLTVNEESIAQIIHYEYPAHRNSEFNEISLVLPSDILVRKNRKITFLKSFQKVNRTREKKDREYINELRETVDQYFKDTYRYMKEPMGIYLSKGKDSRYFLPFLERNMIPYIPFVFKEDTGIFDYHEVKKIAELLDKDLHVMEQHSIDRTLSYLLSMSTTATSPWVALGKIAGNYVSNALMGLYGESSSGKLCAHRSYGINNFESSVKATILGNSRGISSEDAKRNVPYFSKYDTEAAYRNIYKDHPPVQILYDHDTYQDIDHRSFRNAVVILLKTQHFITPLTPFMDKHVAAVYHKLPESLLRTQLAHTIIAGEETKSNRVKSTAFPVSLKNEKYVRSLLVNIVKFNSKYKDILMARKKKKYKPFINKDSFVPRSDYFKNIYREPVEIPNRRILTRMYNVDEYLAITMHDNLDSYFKPADLIYSEIENFGSNSKFNTIYLGKDETMGGMHWA